MVKNINLEYANAYSEVLEILNRMSDENYNKIPKDMIELFRENQNKKHEFHYNIEKEFDEQNISKRAKLILAILYRDYWATEEQKKEIIAKQNYERQKIEEKKLNKYNIDMFKKRVQNIQIEEKETPKENLEIVKYKKSIIKRIINKIKKIFQKKSV